MQKTLWHAISVDGPTVIDDKPSAITLRPAPVGQGIVFVKENVAIPALIKYTDPHYAKWTSLTRNGVTVHEVEHLLSALLGLGITNVTVEVEGSGVPLLDCSAAPFVELVDQAGIEIQGEPRPLYRVWPTVVAEAMTDFRTGLLRDESARLLAFPQEKAFTCVYVLDYGNTPLETQVAEVQVTPANYRALVAGARTFMTVWEVERWRGNLLSESFYSTVPVFSDKGKFEERYPKEAAYHKILDMIGDLALLGRFPWGMFVGIRSGHSLNKKMARRLKGC